MKIEQGRGSVRSEKKEGHRWGVGGEGGNEVENRRKTAGEEGKRGERELREAGVSIATYGIGR